MDYSNVHTMMCIEVCRKLLLCVSYSIKNIYSHCWLILFNFKLELTSRRHVTLFSMMNKWIYLATKCNLVAKYIFIDVNWCLWIRQLLCHPLIVKRLHLKYGLRYLPTYYKNQWNIFDLMPFWTNCIMHPLKPLD